MFLGVRTLVTGLFPESGQQSVYFAAVLIDNRREFIALGNRHADALDDHIDDLWGALSANAPENDDRSSVLQS